MPDILRVWQHHRRLHVTYGVVWLFLMAVPILVYAEQFTGKVVGISDGDMISMLREGEAVKVRVYGIDAPEKTQACGTRAQRFTAALVF
jgi:micrococcal nuclease